jgi:XTP/dITP diphosphohydrolase
MAAPRLQATLASQNVHKLAELQRALPEWEIEPLEASGDWPEETGETYYDNARLKAVFGRRAKGQGGRYVLGEDSGIEADALDGAPGLHSARWAPSGDQAEALLERLAGEPNRRARMVTELVCLTPDGVELRGIGVLEGTLATEKRGSTGFGYDPIFVPDGEELTVAELGDDWKNEHSHRARAAQALRRALSGLGGAS